VPKSSHSSSRSTSGKNILLLEKYDALAAAIGSALKKFAPGYTVSVARSLVDAESIAVKTPPALLIIDVDPAWPELTDSIEKWRSANPDARVLVIGAGIPNEIADERGSFGGLQFIEKPFELADFGAAVQALLGPWRESESASSRGTLRALNLLDIILLQWSASGNAIVEVEAGRKRYGEVHFSQGQIFHAETARLVGVEALAEIFTWPQPRLSEGKKRPAANRTIHEPWIAIVLELLQRAKTEQPVEPVPSEKVPRPKPDAEGTKKIVVIDDTEMLLIFVEDVLATDHPKWQITKASNGANGCKEVERVLPDLVLLDYSLPDFNGDEVCRRLLQEERTAHVPILMMSGHVLEMSAAATRFENIVATIEKPFLSEALIDLVERTLEGAPSKFETSAERSPIVEPQEPSPPPPQKEESKKSPAPELPTAKPLPSSISSLVPAESGMLRTTTIAAPLTAPVVARSTETILGLFLDVLSMQFTPQLQMGTIRAKPSSFTVSLHLPSSVHDSMPAETGFELARTELDANGHIATIRLIPTMKPFQPAKTRNAFEIGGVSVVDGDKRERVQLTPTVTAPMTMQLLAQLDLGGVELSTTFQVSHVILKWRSDRVRVTLSSNATAGDLQSAAFEIAVVQLDPRGRISELTLNPIR
jgi:DNA-binding response OmpR family regulator